MVATVDDVAADFLLANQELLVEDRRSPGREELWGDPEPLALARAQLDAFAAAGLLTAAEAREWLALVLAERPPSSPVEPRVRQAVAEFAEPLVREGSLAGPDPWDEVRRTAALTSSLEELGLLDPGLGRRLMELVEERWCAAQEDDPEPPDPTLVDLERVIVGPAVRRRGLRIVGAELYADGVLLRVHVARPERHEDGSWPVLPDEVEVPGPAWAVLPELGLFDDRGTRYQRGGGGGHGSAADAGTEVSIETVEFTPGVPASARALWACQGSGRFDLLSPA